MLRKNFSIILKGEEIMPNIKSNISFGLVNIPVIMNPIIKNNDTSFNQLHTKCHERIKYIKYCPLCKVDVKEKDIIKGYEYEKDKYVIFKKEELDKLKPEADKEIEIVSFVPIQEVDPVYFEKSYVLSVEGKGKAYTLFSEALNKSKLVAVAKTVIGSKFYYCILRFSNKQIVMTTLYFEEEVEIPKVGKVLKSDPKELSLALKIIDSMRGTFEPQKYKDEYQDNIRNAIEDKLDGKTIKGSKKKNKKQIDDLLEALEKSLKKS